MGQLLLDVFRKCCKDNTISCQRIGCTSQVCEDDKCCYPFANCLQSLAKSEAGVNLHDIHHHSSLQVFMWYTIYQLILNISRYCGSLLISLPCLFNHTEVLNHSEIYWRYAMLFVHRHSFLRLKRSAQLIQQAVRSWLYWRRQQLQGCSISPQLTTSDPVSAAITVQKFVRGWIARSRYIHLLEQKEKALYLAQQKAIFDLQTNPAVSIQLAWKKFTCHKSIQMQHFFATKIQCNFRRWLLRKRFLHLTQSVIKIQSYFRTWRCLNAYQHFRVEFKAAVVIQSFSRGWIVRKGVCARRNHIVVIQVRH